MIKFKSLMAMPTLDPYSVVLSAYSVVLSASGSIMAKGWSGLKRFRRGRWRAF